MSTYPLQASRASSSSGETRGARRVGLGRAILALAGVLLVGLTTIASAGRPGDGSPPPPPPPGGGNPGDPGDGDGTPGGTSMEDESIGSLPIMAGGFTFLPPGLALPGLQPSMYIEGPTANVFDALLGATGSGVIQIQELGADRLQIVFHGDMHVDFALASFFDDALEVGLVTGAELGHVAAAIVHEGRIVVRTALRGLQKLELPVQELLALDELKSGVDLYTRDVLGGREHYRLASHGGLLTMSSR